VHSTKSQGNASKKIDYLPFFRLLSFQTNGVTSIARLQREEVSREKNEHADLIAILQGSTLAVHPL
jgi:hypothetical protein